MPSFADQDSAPWPGCLAFAGICNIKTSAQRDPVIAAPIRKMPRDSTALNRCAAGSATNGTRFTGSGACLADDGCLYASFSQPDQAPLVSVS